MADPAPPTASTRKVFTAFADRPNTWLTTAALFRITQLHNATLRAALNRLVLHGLVMERGQGPGREYRLTTDGVNAAPMTLAQLRAEVQAGVTDQSVLDAALRAIAAPGKPHPDGH